MGFINGQMITYHSGGGVSINGLIDGIIYFVKTTANPNVIQLSATAGGFRSPTRASRPCSRRKCSST